MRVLLLYRSGKPGAGDYFARMLPVGLAWINATLRQAGFDSSLANLSRITWQRIESLLRRERPDVVGITLYTFNRHQGLKLAALAKKLNPRCVVIVGGPHATHVGASILRHYPAVTAVGVGEGEITMLEVARAVRDGASLHGVRGLLLRGASGEPIATGARDTVSDLDALPFPSAHFQGYHLDVETDASFIITSRGCPARCTFCNTPDFWGTRMRFRSPRHMVDEFRYLKERLGILYISVRDDTFTVHKRRVIEFCERLIASRLDVMWNCQSRVNAIDEERLSWMRRAGCDHIQYGVESGSERILRQLAKDITLDEIREASRATRKMGLTLSIYLIGGVPGETEDDYRATEALLREIRPHDGIVSPLAVFPGTHLYDAMKRAGAIDDDHWVRERSDTLYAMTGGPARRSHERLARLCASVGARAPYTRAELERHKALLPDAFATWISSGLAYEAEGSIGAALGEYEEIERFSPANLWACLHIGKLLLRTGDTQGAEIYFARALASAPSSRAVKELLETSRKPRAGARVGA